MSFLTLCQMTKPLTSTTLKTSNRTEQVVFHIMECVIDKADKKKKKKKEEKKKKMIIKLRIIWHRRKLFSFTGRATI